MLRHRLSYFHLCPIWPPFACKSASVFFFFGKFYNKNIFCRVLWSLIISFTIKEKQLLLCKGLKKIRPWKKNYRRGFKSIGFFYPVNHITSLRDWLSVGMKRLKILNKNANFVGKAEFGFVSQVLKHLDCWWWSDTLISTLQCFWKQFLQRRIKVAHGRN